MLEVRSNDPERAADLAWAHGAMGIEERPDHLRVTFGDQTHAARAAAACRPLGPVRDITADVATDWLATWAEHARATIEPPFVIRAPWLERPEAADSIDLVIDPGPTFGHGGHPTTRLLLRSLPARVHPDTRVLDVGCGSGVLAIAAARLGASHVTAIDIDPVARQTTRDNARRNDIPVTVIDQPLSEIDERFDLVLANLLLPALTSLADDLRRVCTGTLSVSGLLAGQGVKGLPDLVTADEEDGWVRADLRCD